MNFTRTMRMFVFALPTVMLFIACSGGKDGKESAEPINEITYQASDAEFPNPERGFYRFSQTNLGMSPSPLSESTLKSWRAQNFTLVFRYFYLKEFKDKALSQAALDQIDADMAVIRKAGMKCVMRYAYSSNENEADAPLNIVLQHLDQLKSVLEKNADVIAVLQAGFIGAWGEWYYSSNNLKNPTVRASILDKMLEVLPAKRMIQVRTQEYKKEYLNRTTPLTRAEAYTGSKAARMGHHNDCFMASPDDYGTYDDVEAGKTYLNGDALYVPIGGETCPPQDIDPADCKKAESEMRNLRWSFLNEDYFHGVNDTWITQGCMDNIVRNMGYRIVLQSSACNSETTTGGTLNLTIKLINQGYASMYNPRKMELVLKNEETSEVYVAATDEDPRFWLPQILTEVKASVGIPKDMPEGSMYYLYLHLPDPEPLLYGNPDYSVQLANKDVWDPATGYNNLYQPVEIKKTTASSYSGEVWFEKKK